jgi:hypothetical protein
MKALRFALIHFNVWDNYSIILLIATILIFAASGLIVLGGYKIAEKIPARSHFTMSLVVRTLSVSLAFFFMMMAFCGIGFLYGGFHEQEEESSINELLVKTSEVEKSQEEFGVKSGIL